MSWIPLTSEAELDAHLASPEPVWLLKHSESCGVSHGAHDQVAAFLARHPEQRVGLIVIQSHRPLSHRVAARLNITHQSPQLFLLQGGRLRWVVSHWAITAAAMEQALAKLAEPA